MITYQLQINRLITQIACKNSYCDHFYHNQSTLPHSPPASKDFARPLTLVCLLSLAASLLEQDQSRSQMVSNRGLYSERKVCVCVRVWVNVCVWVVFCMCVHFSLSLSLSLDSKIPVTTPLMVGIFSDRRHEEESRPRSIAAVIRALFSLRLNMRTRTTPFAPAVSKREIGQWLA